jgi:GT2 family glycosyltransferase
MTQPIDLSIIIVTYNGRDITLQTLQSYREAIAADPEHTYEIVVVDNASRDGVADAVAAQYPGVRLIRNAENLGFARAGNIGFEASSGRYILSSNPDIEVDASTLPTLIQLMDRDPQVGACTPYLELVKTGRLDWGAHRGFPTPWASFTYFTGLSRLFQGSRTLSRIFGRYELRDRDMSVQHEVDAILGGFFFVRRCAFVEAGRWDERYFMFAEDIDLCYQLKQLGYKVMFYPHVHALHYHGLTTGLKQHSQDVATSSPEERERAYNAFYDTMKLFYEKNYGTKYGALIKWFVFMGIDAKKRMGSRGKTV